MGGVERRMYHYAEIAMYSHLYHIRIIIATMLLAQFGLHAFVSYYACFFSAVRIQLVI